MRQMRCLVAVVAITTGCALSGCGSSKGDGPPHPGGAGGSGGGSAGNAGSAGSPEMFPGGACPDDMDLGPPSYSPESGASGDSVTVTLEIEQGAPSAECEVKFWINCQPSNTTATWHTLALDGTRFEGLVPIDCSGEPQALDCSYSLYYNRENGVTHSGGGFPGPSCSP